MCMCVFEETEQGEAVLRLQKSSHIGSLGSAGTHTHNRKRERETQSLCVDLRANEWMTGGCRGWREQCRGNKTSFSGKGV